MKTGSAHCASLDQFSLLADPGGCESESGCVRIICGNCPQDLQ